MSYKTLVATVIIAFLSSVAVAEDCYGDKEIEVLALNIYHEARGEPIDGMQMVGEVTLNRVYHESYPDNICDVVYQRRQFSWTHTIKNHDPQEEESWAIALELAEGLINGEVEYFNNGATHFINPDKVSRVPNWTYAFDTVGKIGNHVFYAM
jgi:spore germination cell wall hydrolase CwlJ-like protein